MRKEIAFAFAFVMLVIPIVSAMLYTANGTMTDDNGTIYNVTITLNLPEINNTYYLNQTNITYFYNYTNITTNLTCYNCTYNMTNISYINQTIYNYSYFYNGTNFSVGDYYKISDVDMKINGVLVKFDDYLLKSEYNTTNSSSNWRGTDTWLLIGLIAGILLSLFAVISINMNS